MTPTMSMDWPSDCCTRQDTRNDREECDVVQRTPGQPVLLSAHHLPTLSSSRSINHGRVLTRKIGFCKPMYTARKTRHSGKKIVHSEMLTSGNAPPTALESTQDLKSTQTSVSCRNQPTSTIGHFILNHGGGRLGASSTNAHTTSVPSADSLLLFFLRLIVDLDDPTTPSTTCAGSVQPHELLQNRTLNILICRCLVAPFRTPLLCGRCETPQPSPSFWSSLT